MADTIAPAVIGYRDIAVMWVRASMAYPASFWMMAVSGFVIGGLDFVGIWIMFSTVDSLGGFGLDEIGFLYGASGLGLAIADMFVGRIERLGQLIRLGKLDTMMVRPVPLLAQVCADEFALRRISRVVQTGLILGIASWFVHWTPARVAVAVVMIVSGTLIFFSIWIALACVQFWTAEASEVANAFTYGGNTMTQYPLNVFPGEIVKVLTFLFPIAFVNWYPALYILGRPDPFGLPAWFQFASPIAAAVLVSIAALTWRTGVRRYTSTGS